MSYLPADGAVTPLKVTVPPLPTKPTFWPPEQPVQLEILAGATIVFAGDSASYSFGPGGGGTAPSTAVRPSNTTCASVPVECDVTKMPASCVAACADTVAVPTGDQPLPSLE